MMNAISFGKGKITFQILFTLLFRCAITTCQLNLYNTDQTVQSNSLQYDCLNYYGYREKIAYQELSDITDEVIVYCFRPANNFDETFGDAVNPLSQKLSFEELRLANITSEELLSWSIPIDVTERYQFYLNEPKFSLNEHVYNCTEPWFGLRCQYSLEFGESRSFNEIVETTFLGRKPYSESSGMMVQIPCYVFLKCHRNGQFWCLDWREVCDGNVDCYDEGLDEAFCFEMEVNECKEDEYRCHNGLCISKDLWEEGEGDAECLDRSDEAPRASYIKLCFQDPTFRCEEYSCRPHDEKFPCGDGQCVRKFETCPSGRHVPLIESMTAKGNLTNECWTAMVCLTKLVERVNGILCKRWIMNNLAYEFLKHCDPFFQFPTIPVHSDHIRFFYENRHLNRSLEQFFIPDYICYDQQLCDSIIPRLVHENLTCLQNDKFFSILHMVAKSWIIMSYMIEHDFAHCSTFRIIFHNKTQYSNHPSLYQCPNSSKFISKHRIRDANADCFGEDDERYDNSCLLNQSYRVSCCDPNICWSPLLKTDVCRFESGQSREKIPFQKFCNGIKEYYFYDNNGEEQNDESGCEPWLCDNMYARCDGYWSCFDGRDENNCSRTKCSSGTYACVSPINYTVICLSHEQVNDKEDDCLGAADEQEECRWRHSASEYRFRCSNTMECFKPSQLCDHKRDCPSGDDEDFCKNSFRCDKGSVHNRSEIEEVLCGLSEAKNDRTQYFSVHTSSNYPASEKNVFNETTYWSTERHSLVNINVSRIKDNFWPWYCNRGLIIYTLNGNNSYNKTCICPPSYYGHLCQYQNQRISLTLKLSSIDRHITYAIVVMLIDDNDEEQKIDAYDQFVYIPKQSCNIKLNRYLLFSTRPKNVSKNYSIRIDAFDKNSMTYVGSWHFPISFLFLPVNRLAISIVLSNHLIHRLSRCSISCINGECVKYLNTEKYFCRCNSTWSGIHCNMRINCQTCSSNSICIGSSNNQSICLCPLDKFGFRCLLTSACSMNACQNNGQCVPADPTIPESDYTCICPDRFFGKNCEKSKSKLEVSLNDIHIPPYLVAYFFTLSNKSEPMKTTILRKLTLFQHIVTFDITVPFHIVIIQAIDKYYLAVLQQSPKKYISTSISFNQECRLGKQLFNSTVLSMVQYQRIIHYYDLCRRRLDLTCFIDEYYLCFCTNDHHANCMEFNHDNNLQCLSNNHCLNKGQCLQDHPTCPSTRICLCPNCFFGNQCQLYAKGLGSTLDEILGYEFKHNTILSQQSSRIKLSVGITILIFVIGIINGILSIMTFLRKKSRTVGCGIYLLASSIVSLVIMTLFIFKFWFLFLSHQDYLSKSIRQIILIANCRCIEFLLKIFLSFNNWLNACVAIERTISVYKGISFNTIRSERIAYWIVGFSFIIIFSLSIPQLLELHVFEDKIEERSWCVVNYSSWLQIYSLTLIFFHYFGPLSINLFSALFIIIRTTRQRAAAKTGQSFWIHLKCKLKQYNYLLISPAIIIILTLPHLIISIILDCNRSSNSFWFYLIGYFFSFIPTAFVFIIFVIPSPLYRKEFIELLSHIRRRFSSRFS